MIKRLKKLIIALNSVNLVKCILKSAEYLFQFSQNFPLAIERDSAHAGSTIEDCILSYKSDFILHNSTLHVPFYDRFRSN